MVSYFFRQRHVAAPGGAGPGPGPGTRFRLRAFSFSIFTRAQGPFAVCLPRCSRSRVVRPHSASLPHPIPKTLVSIRAHRAAQPTSQNIRVSQNPLKIYNLLARACDTWCCSCAPARSTTHGTQRTVLDASMWVVGQCSAHVRCWSGNIVKPATDRPASLRPQNQGAASCPCCTSISSFCAIDRRTRVELSHNPAFSLGVETPIMRNALQTLS